jgi:dTDP-4-amino-4,6-dideoxygalactose transaminase
LLPNADKLLPYLQRIDRNRVYSNFGPLSIELGKKLADHFHVDMENIMCANSGTSALTAAILSRAGRATKEKSLAIVPSFTFVATALAAEACGYEVVFADVTVDSWGLDPVQLISFPKLAQVGIVIPVAPFGRPVTQISWQKFEEATGVPVVIDGAACFETVQYAANDYLGQIPVAMSFHATKSFSTGEGGCVLSTDRELINRVLQSLNFGFVKSRECEHPSINGKMSEYHAAVGLAEMDHWQEKFAALMWISELYREEFTARGIINKLVIAPEICSSYVLYIATDETESNTVQFNLSSNGIGYRRWYDQSLQRHKHFRRIPSENTPVSDDLQKRVLGLPVAPDFDSDTIKFICKIVSAPA